MPPILLLSEETEAAKTAFDSIKAKINDYFTRCRLAEFDQRASDPLNPALTEYQALSSKNLSTDSEQIASPCPLQPLCNHFPAHQSLLDAKRGVAVEA